MKMVSLCLRSWMPNFSSLHNRDESSSAGFDRFSLFMWKSRTQVCCACYNNRLCCFYNSLAPSEAPAFLPLNQEVFHSVAIAEKTNTRPGPNHQPVGVWPLRRWPGYQVCSASAAPSQARGPASCVRRPVCWRQHSGHLRPRPAGPPPRGSAHPSGRKNDHITVWFKQAECFRCVLIKQTLHDFTIHHHPTRIIINTLITKSTFESMWVDFWWLLEAEITKHATSAVSCDICTTAINLWSYLYLQTEQFGRTNHSREGFTTAETESGPETFLLLWLSPLKRSLIPALTWNSGPMSTSNPRSAKPVAMTLAPLSWPSWPIFATSRRGFLPSCFLKSAILKKTKGTQETEVWMAWSNKQLVNVEEASLTGCGPRRSPPAPRTHCGTPRSPSWCWLCVPQTRPSWHQWSHLRSIWKEKQKSVQTWSDHEAAAGDVKVKGRQQGGWSLTWRGLPPRPGPAGCPPCSGHTPLWLPGTSSPPRDRESASPTTERPSAVWTAAVKHNIILQLRSHDSTGTFQI